MTGSPQEPLPFIFYDPKKEEWHCYCDKCGTDPETEEAQKAQGWVRVYLPPENETRAKKGLWYCECCHDLLPDIPPVHRVLPPRKED